MAHGRKRGGSAVAGFLFGLFLSLIGIAVFTFLNPIPGGPLEAAKAELMAGLKAGKADAAAPAAPPEPSAPPRPAPAETPAPVEDKPEVPPAEAPEAGAPADNATVAPPAVPTAPSEPAPVTTDSGTANGQPAANPEPEPAPVQDTTEEPEPAPEPETPEDPEPVSVPDIPADPQSLPAPQTEPEQAPVQGSSLSPPSEPRPLPRPQTQIEPEIAATTPPAPPPFEATAVSAVSETADTPEPVEAQVAEVVEESPQSAPEPETPDVAPAPVADTDLPLPAIPEFAPPAWKAFAQERELAQDKPLLAIVLVDIGEEGISRENLLALSAPVNFGILADDAKARWSDAAYRAAGFETVAVMPQNTRLSLDRGTDPARAEQVIAATFEAVPGAVAYLDQIGGELARDNAMLLAIFDEIAAPGRALLTYPGGLRGVDQLAARLGVPSAVAEPLIDARPDPVSIALELDSAAFEAGRSGTRIAVGTTHPQTIQALFEWLQTGRARTVQIAPLSAVLERTMPE